jgi:hypothetical protein
MGEPPRFARRRAIRGSLRSYLRALTRTRGALVRLVRGFAAPLLSLSLRGAKKRLKIWKFGGNGVCLCVGMNTLGVGGSRMLANINALPN